MMIINIGCNNNKENNYNDVAGPEELIYSTTSIKIDQDFKVHISYYDFDDKLFYYVSNSGGEWKKIKILKSYFSTADSYTSLAVDSNGYIHIICEYKGGLVYCSNANGDWLIEYVNWETKADFSEINIGINDVPVILTGLDGNLILAKRISEKWEFEKIIEVEELYGNHPFVIDDGNNLHCLVKELKNNIIYLIYITNENGQWSTKDIDAYTNKEYRYGIYSSIAKDRNNNIIISYVGEKTGYINYVVKREEVWRNNEVALQNDYEEVYQNIIAKGPKNQVLIGYSTYDYIGILIPAKENWKTDKLPENGSDMNMDTDKNGIIHISYIGREGGLVYSSNKNGEWELEEID